MTIENAGGPSRSQLQKNIASFCYESSSTPMFVSMVLAFVASGFVKTIDLSEKATHVAKILNDASIAGVTASGAITFLSVIAFNKVGGHIKKEETSILWENVGKITSTLLPFCAAVMAPLLSEPANTIRLECAGPAQPNYANCTPVSIRRP